MNAGSEGQQAVLERFVAACEQDERVVAAFLGGSLAAGKADEWSDLDIYLITTDESYQDFAAGFRAFVGRLGQPLFLESFGRSDTLFFIFADDTEGEISLGSESAFLDIHDGPYKVLVDKKGILEGVKFLGYRPTPDEQLETLRGQVYWFWHNLSHFITAIGRGQLWWAQGQLEALRNCCVNLARLEHNFADANVGDEPYFKVENAIPTGELAPLEPTFRPMEPGALQESVFAIVAFYRKLAPPLAERHGIEYPADLERLMLSRLERLRTSMP